MTVVSGAGSAVSPAEMVNSTHIFSTMPGLRDPSLAPVERAVELSTDGVTWLGVGTIQERYGQCAVINEAFTSGLMPTPATGVEPIRRQLWAAAPSGRVAVDCR